MRGPPHDEGGKWDSEEEEIKEGLEEREASCVSLALDGGGAICFDPIKADWLAPSLLDELPLPLMVLVLLVLLALLMVWGRRKDQRL